MKIISAEIWVTEYPESCRECDLAGFTTRNMVVKDLYCRATRKVIPHYVYMNSRPDFCPLKIPRQS